MSNTITATVVKFSKIFGKWSHRYLCHREFSPITLFCRRGTSVFQETWRYPFFGGGLNLSVYECVWVCVGACVCASFLVLLFINAENPIGVHRYCSGSFFHLAVMPLTFSKIPKVFSFISWLFSREDFFFPSFWEEGRGNHFWEDHFKNKQTKQSHLEMCNILA